MEFQGKVAVVTGAAQGIGLAVAQALLRGGAQVAALDRQAEGLRQADAALSITLDVCDGPGILSTVARIERELGPIDILVNVAGVLKAASVLDTHDEDWEATFAVNTMGVFRMSRAVARGMVARRQGVIVTVGSNAAQTPRTQMSAYAASKAASAQFTRCLALELAPHGVRCNIVSPGSTDTAMQRQLWSRPDSAQAVIRGSLEDFRLGIPLGRLAQAEDIAQAVCFLASDRARHITMHDLRVDGGATLDA